MIHLSELFEIGTFGKPHGVKGEVTVAVEEPDVDFSALRCIVTDIDGIYVPFFIDSVRSKGAMSLLVKIDGVDNEMQASAFSRKPVYALRSDLDFEVDDDAADCDDGMYAEDLVGYTLVDTELGEIGTVSAVNDVTDNVLFVIARPDGSEVFIPAAGDMITDIDEKRKVLTMDLPLGLIDLN